jgi:hypothetical protein
MELNSKHGPSSKTIWYQSAAIGSNTYCMMDGKDLLVLEFLAPVLRVPVLIVILIKFEPLVIVSSAYPNVGLTVTVSCHWALEIMHPFICFELK